MAGKNTRMGATASNARARKKRVRAVADVTVTFRNIQPTAALTTYARRKLGHIAKFASRPCQIHLILSVDKYRQRGEVTVKTGRWAVTAVEETKDLYAAIDLLADNAGRQLKKQIEKLKTSHMRAISAGELLSAAEEI